MKEHKKAKIERILLLVIPIIVGAIFVVSLKVGCDNGSLEINNMDGLETIKLIIGIWATLLGFSITAESILLTIRGGDFTSLFIKAGHLNTVLFSYTLTNLSMLICIIIFIPIILLKYWGNGVFLLFAFCTICSFVYLFFSIYYFFMMIGISRR